MILESINGVPQNPETDFVFNELLKPQEPYQPFYDVKTSNASWQSQWKNFPFGVTDIDKVVFATATMFDNAGNIKDFLLFDRRDINGNLERLGDSFCAENGVSIILRPDWLVSPVYSFTNLRADVYSSEYSFKLRFYYIRD